MIHKPFAICSVCIHIITLSQSRYAFASDLFGSTGNSFLFLFIFTGQLICMYTKWCRIRPKTWQIIGPIQIFQIRFSYYVQHCTVWEIGVHKIYISSRNQIVCATFSVNYGFNSTVKINTLANEQNVYVEWDMPCRRIWETNMVLWRHFFCSVLISRHKYLKISVDQNYIFAVI